jgi:hypothetical protein
MKKTTAFLVFLFVFSGIQAQTSGQIATYTPGVGAETDGLYMYAMGSIEDKLDKLKYDISTIEGSPYMSNTFESGQLYYGDELVGNIFYRYNAYNEEIEIKQENRQEEPVRGLSKDKKIRLVTQGKPTSFKTFIDKSGNTKNGYLTLLASGDYNLYKHLKVTFKEAKKAENSFVQDSPAKFSQFTEYFLEDANGKRINEIEMSNKKIVQLVDGEKRNELKAFLKENKIKIKDVNDLYKVMDFLNGEASGS